MGEEKENPSDRKYTKEHEWIKVDGDVGTVGITEHAQHLLTDVVFVELPNIGRQVEAMKQLAVVESVKSVSDVFAPASGIVSEVNKELSEHPEKINNDPFNEGWIAKLKLTNMAELGSLMSKEEYDKFLKEDSH